MDLKINTKSHEPWFRPLGKLVINFGTIDLLISLLVMKVTGKSDLPTTDFEVKLKTIENSLNTLNLAQVDRRILSRAINNCRKIYGLRISIFHSPIIGLNHQGVHNDIIMSVDLKKKKVVKLETVNNALNKMVEVGSIIQEIIGKLS